VRRYQQLFRYEDVALEFSDAALPEIAHRAIAQGTGARGLRSVLETVLQRTMYELLSHPDVARCRVDEDAVTGKGSVRFDAGRMVGGGGDHPRSHHARAPAIPINSPVCAMVPHGAFSR
jgi:hypothetical protein